MRHSRLVTQAFIIFILSSTTIPAQQGNDWVDADHVYTFTNDGCWCWFQDERAVVDTAKNKLIISSANMQASVDVTIFNLETMESDDNVSKRFSRFQSRQGEENTSYSDDHNSPAVLVMANGNYLAMWAHHYDYRHHYSIYRNSSWSNERTIEWKQWGNSDSSKVAYSNLYYLSDEHRIYNFSRVYSKAPNFVISEDNGETWNYGGQLTTNESRKYTKGYYKYWGNGVDRIDMVFTEEHPRDTTTSIYHGYIQDGRTYNTEGVLADENIFDRDYIPTFESFTKVFAHGTNINGIHMGRCWQHDICRYDDGTIVILFKARADDNYDDHRNFYARYNGKDWKYTYLGKAGEHIYGNEHDYVGLGSVNPDDPNRIYLCTRYNPGDDDEPPASKREIWRGTTEDKGETWEWEPVTANSTQDNFRPIVPKWKPGKEVVIWFKAENYIKAQDIQNSKIIGVFYNYEPPLLTNPVKNQPKQTNSRFSLSSSTQQVSIQFEVPELLTVTLKVFSLSGKRVATLINSSKDAGAHSFNWNTAAVPAGTYLVRLSVDSTFYMERTIVQH